ncbi:ABC transporter substrate-binding protein [Sutterella sp.]|uniref:ABC transporter substrate-binding protein n=1 Tax=Sutterella sp. TaxID=1981025 RepID=UPI0026E0AA7D|nr:ABC transporter substrate-binding protein [Sutterella sp.]MDO5532058.1 ABC transporter substrate-binding protein [Sutterella sp.]
MFTPRIRAALAGFAACLTLAGAAGAANAESVIRIVPNADLKILDPFWTTAFVTRHHGYMIYDTLFGLTQKGEIKPQMIDTWTVSPDNMHYSFTLREGLKFSDGTDVTTKDVIQSIRRWGARDNLGSKLLAVLDKMEPKDARTFTLDFKEPFGVVLDAFSKPSSIPLFIMPEKVAQTDPYKQITEMTGSGPYAFVPERYRPGERVVYVKNKYYKPRAEAPDGTTGGKNVYVDEVHWVILRDAQTQVNAIEKGEVDVIEKTPNEHFKALNDNPAIELVNQTGKTSSMLHINHAIPPFNNPKIAQAALMAINQTALLRAQIVYKELYNTCTSIYPCGSVYASDNTGYFTGKPQFAKAKALLKEAGYDGTPIVLLLPADVVVLNKYPTVMAELLRRAGFTVDLQSTDWASVLTRRSKSVPVSEGGWNAFITNWSEADTFNPVFFAPLTGSGMKGWFGWTDDPELERLKDEFIKASDIAEKKKIAEGIQLRVMESGVYGMLGEFKAMTAVRKEVTGIVPAPINVYWNLKKDEK